MLIAPNDIRISTYRVAGKNGDVVDSDQPFGVDSFFARSNGLHLNMSQQRGVSVELEIRPKDLLRAMEVFSKKNPNLAKTIALIMLGEAAKAEIDNG